MNSVDLVFLCIAAFVWLAFTVGAIYDILQREVCDLHEWERRRGKWFCLECRKVVF